jgi:hypothetical protein
MVNTNQLSLDFVLSDRVAEITAENKIEQECREFLFEGKPKPAFSMSMNVAALNAIWDDGLVAVRQWEDRWSKKAEPFRILLAKTDKRDRKARRPLQQEIGRLLGFGEIAKGLHDAEFTELQSTLFEEVTEQWEARGADDDQMEAACEDFNNLLYERRCWDESWHFTIQDAADISILGAMLPALIEPDETGPEEFRNALLTARRRKADGTLGDRVNLTSGELYFGGRYQDGRSACLVSRIAREAGIKVTDDAHRKAA